MNKLGLEPIRNQTVLPTCLQKTHLIQTKAL
jgi:hypothetical protein